MASLGQWSDLWQRLGARCADASLFERLRDAWSEPHRHYHTLQHLDECLGHVGALADATDRADELELALWFHDAVFTPGAEDNELRSAQWALEVCNAAGLASAIAARVQGLILVTARDARPFGPEQELMVDVDLASLAAPTSRFCECERQLRLESDLDDACYRAERRSKLASFLTRPRIFHSARFHGACEEGARKNIGTELQRLSDPARRAD